MMTCEQWTTEQIADLERERVKPIPRRVDRYSDGGSGAATDTPESIAARRAALADATRRPPLGGRW